MSSVIIDRAVSSTQSIDKHLYGYIILHNSALQWSFNKMCLLGRTARALTIVALVFSLGGRSACGDDDPYLANVLTSNDNITLKRFDSALR